MCASVLTLLSLFALATLAAGQSCPQFPVIDLVSSSLIPRVKLTSDRDMQDMRQRL